MPHKLQKQHLSLSHLPAFRRENVSARKRHILDSKISFAFSDLLTIPLKMNVVLLGITLALATVSEAQTCNQGSVASANPLGTCGGCEDQVQC